MKKYIITFCLAGLFFNQTVSAQQEIILTKYAVNSMFFNPAFAGSHGLNEGSALLQYRNQWLGLEGAPVTYLAAAESSFFKDRVGLGLNIGRETIGVASRTDIYTNYAYRIKINRESRLSGGIRFGASVYGSDFNQIEDFVREPTAGFPDPVYLDDVNYTVLNAGAGMYWNSDDFFLGFSVPSLVTIGNDVTGVGYKQRHLYVHIGLKIGEEESTFKIEPTILFKYQRAAPIQTTIGMNLWLNDALAIGAHWRTSDAFALSLELMHNEKYRLAVAYDFTTSQIRTISNGSIEMGLGYYFNTNPEDAKRRKLQNR